jgi:ketosteroid isomerase-like protein
LGVEENKAVATAFLEIVSGQRVGDPLALATSDAIWWSNGASGGVRGVREVLAGLDGLRARATGPMEGSLGALTAEGDRVAVETAGRMPLKGGEVYANRAHLLFTLRDGKIASIREYGDTEVVARLFGRRAEGAAS